jgi:DNA repair exonuclease SbcCD ATPase subunit
VSLPVEDEGSFAAGRQALLEALQSLEQRAKDRAEKMTRDAERSARQITLESEQRAYQVTAEAEERARQVVQEAEQRAKQVTLDAAQRLSDLEAQLTEVRDNLEAARAQLEEQVVSVRGQVELARATLNTVRERLAAGAPNTRPPEARPVAPPPRLAIPALSIDRPVESPSGPTLSDLRAAVDALKRPRVAEASLEEAEPTPAASSFEDEYNSTSH